MKKGQRVFAALLTQWAPTFLNWATQIVTHRRVSLKAHTSPRDDMETISDLVDPPTTPSVPEPASGRSGLSTYSAGSPGSSGGPRSVPSETTPPLLIGGVKQQIPNKGLGISLSGVGFDYLTVSVPSGTSAEILMHQSALDEPGRSSQGFKQSEKRICMGGHCWRKFDPQSPSKLWGLDYESWEYSGVTCVEPIRTLIDQPSRPSRLDIAYDFCIPHDDLYPMDLEPLFLDRCNERGIEIDWKGRRLKQTVYVGSDQSERRIRIYRRDLKNLLMAEEGQLILRVELVLQKSMCHDMWRHMRTHGIESAYRAGAAHIAEMIGYAPISADWDDLPEVIRTNEDAHAYQMTLQFIQQHAVMLTALNRCGIDVFDLAEKKIDSSKSATARHRLNKKLDALATIDPAQLQRLVAAHL